MISLAVFSLAVLQFDLVPLAARAACAALSLVPLTLLSLEQPAAAARCSHYGLRNNSLWLKP